MLKQTAIITPIERSADPAHGRTRALLRALAHDVEVLLEESQGLPSAITQKLCRRDVRRAKEMLVS